MRKDIAVLDGDTDCDVAIVGAGYTGVSAARRIAALEPTYDIVLLDASTIGEGNPGRNSGFLLEVALAHDADLANIQRMRRCNELLQETMDGLRDDVQKLRIDCGLARSGTYRAAAGKTGETALYRYREFLDASGLPSESLGRDELHSRIGTRFYRRGLYSPHCYLVQPAAMIRGLVRSLPGSVRLFECTPARSVEQHNGHWQVTTARGVVRAAKLILANNSFCRGLGVGAERISAIYTYAALTDPVHGRDRLLPGTDDQWGLLPAHRLGSTLRRTPDGRLLVRSLYSYERDTDIAKVETRLRAALSRRFPNLGGAPFAAVWGGATGFTYNAAPLWGELAKGLFVSAGCNGGGIVKGTLFGKLLGELTLGQASANVAELFGTASRMPPEPLRGLGFALIAAVERCRARAEV